MAILAIELTLVVRDVVSEGGKESERMGNVANSAKVSASISSKESGWGGTGTLPSPGGSAAGGGDWAGPPGSRRARRATTLTPPCDTNHCRRYMRTVSLSVPNPPA